jgi:predicted nucleic acid-binding protein
MAKEPVLIDSSFYIRQERTGYNALDILPYLSMERDLVICGMVRCEVGRGIKDNSLRQDFQAAWDIMINVNTDNKLWEMVEQTAWDLDRHGLVLPLQDIFIACCAKQAGAIVLTHDRHFLSIPGCKVALTPGELI